MSNEEAEKCSTLGSIPNAALKYICDFCAATSDPSIGHVYYGVKKCNSCGPLGLVCIMQDQTFTYFLQSTWPSTATTKHPATLSIVNMQAHVLLLYLRYYH